MEQQKDIKLSDFLENLKKSLDFSSINVISNEDFEILNKALENLKKNFVSLNTVFQEIKNIKLDLSINIPINETIGLMNNINYIIKGNKIGGSDDNQVLLNNLLNNDNFVNLLNNIYDNIQLTVYKTENIAKNLDIINTNIDNLDKKMSSNNISKNDIDNIINKINEIHNILINSNNIFDLTNINNNNNNDNNNDNNYDNDDNDDINNNLTENIFNDNLKNDKINKGVMYNKLMNKQKLLNIVEFINNYNNVNDISFTLMKDIIEKLSKFLDSAKKIIKYFNEDLYDEIELFKNNNKNNILFNLNKINENSIKINKLFDGIKNGGNNFFLKKNMIL